MSAVVIVGAQWGDEGKGKIVDLYTESADVVVRFAGGPNAGHTLVVGDDKIVVRLVPSGILRAQARCIMAQGMVVDPAVLVSEIDVLEARGHTTRGRLFVSDLAHLILPYHRLVDGLREATATDGQKIGTTKRGIGPCYEDKAARRGIRVGDLADLDGLEQKLARAASAWGPVVRELGGEMPDVAAMMTELRALAPRIVPLIADTAVLANDAIQKGERVMFEGAQGTLLDLDHGTYPFVTSSSAVAGGACVGAGVGPTRIKRVLGITKGYATRVGEGPFPTELSGELGERLRVAGGEFGSVTGRPRRTGWLDLPALRYAARVNGLDGLAVTKLDVLSGLDTIEVCVAYDTPEGRTKELPIRHVGNVVPVYEKRPGWRESLSHARTMAELPKAAQDYVRYLEAEIGVPVFLVSVGPRRDETIVLKDAFG
ncbi:adenylosuccinate synthase [Polyangium sp. y55x31]|uniref:adenylosuccinate synthase n=1 Tax=Polyangium sp. y55x31 TaxID=3042688 RepID=UPI002482B200|nr:adenylosuccinate synthase [Polyangium sp. y55x31]MDI1478137.1 adenylosuccinate synthase [Polyangium sp. y55x31]